MTRKRRSPELAVLQEAFKLDVLFGGDPDGRPLPCWFRTVDDRPCDGPPRAAHFLKRRRVEKLIDQLLWGAVEKDDPGLAIARLQVNEIVQLAAWDPRNGVPSCEAHDMRHDGLRMPPLVVAAHWVPLDVAFFALDWGVEHELERRCPLFLPSLSQSAGTNNVLHMSTLDVARSERALFDD